MSALTDALEAVKAAKYNALDMADPDAALSEARDRWMEAVTSALDALVSPSTTVYESTAVTPTADEIAALQAEEAALEAKVKAGQAALQALESALHPADASPSSSEPPTIAPSNPG